MGNNSPVTFQAGLADNAAPLSAVVESLFGLAGKSVVELPQLTFWNLLLENGP